MYVFIWVFGTFLSGIGNIYQRIDGILLQLNWNTCILESFLEFLGANLPLCFLCHQYAPAERRVREKEQEQDQVYEQV